MAQQSNFFATQIAQRTVDDPVEEPQSDSPLEEELKLDERGLKQLLAAFNEQDKQQKGIIKLEQAQQILRNKGVSSDKLCDFHKLSQPLAADVLTFDEFLFVFSIAEHSEKQLEERYAYSRLADVRLVQFLKLLNNYRKKCERNGNYKEAKNSKKKVEEIRTRELERRNKYLSLLHRIDIERLKESQKNKFQEFCTNWDTFMNEYEVTAADMTKKLRQRHEIQMADFEKKTRQQLSSKMHFSKQMLELQHMERNFVKAQEYERAGKVQVEIEEQREAQLRQKIRDDEQILETRLNVLKKQQQSAMSSFLQKIQKDRNDQLKQRQTESEKIMVRNKTMVTECAHKHQESLKKIHQALHHLGLDSQKLIK